MWNNHKNDEKSTKRERISHGNEYIHRRVQNPISQFRFDLGISSHKKVDSIPWELELQDC